MGARRVGNQGARRGRGLKGWGAQGVGDPKGWAPKPRNRVWVRIVGGPKGGEPKISRFFFLLPPTFSFFLSLGIFSSLFSLSGCLLVSFSLSLGVFSWNFGGVLVGRDLKCACFRLQAAGGFHTTA